MCEADPNCQDCRAGHLPKPWIFLCPFLQLSVIRDYRPDERVIRSHAGMDAMPLTTCTLCQLEQAVWGDTTTLVPIYFILRR